jgi:transcriptional regulator with XRE-family HTH domain
MPLEVAADRLGIDSERLKAWESGSERPTISQLRHVGNLYRRPLAAFYYPTPPKLSPKLRDMRLLPALANELDWIDLNMEARYGFVR